MSRWKDLIDQAVDCKSAVELYTGTKIINGRIPCPFHNGRDSNLAIYKNCFRCYVCGAKGGVIKFVQMFLDISATDAQRRLNDDFGLGIPMTGRTNVGQQITAKKRLEAIVQKRRKYRDAYDLLLCHYYIADDMYRYWESVVNRGLTAIKSGQETDKDIGRAMGLRDQYKADAEYYYGELCDRRCHG